MSGEDRQYILDYFGYAKEIYAYLITYFIPVEEIDAKALQAQLPEVISEMYEIALGRKVNEMIRNEHRSIGDPVLDLAKEHNLDPAKLESVFMEIPLIEIMLQQADEIASANTFEIWQLRERKGVMIVESLGDYRIFEWENEHVVDGKYNPKAIS